MKSENTALAPALPLMKTFADAVALSEKEKDSFFYLDAFMFQGWLGDLVRQTVTEYAEKKNPRERSLQAGQGWHDFLHLFGHAEARDFPGILSHLFRFTEHNDPLANLLRHALHPLAVEHDCTADYLGPKNIPLPSPPAPGVPLSSSGGEEPGERRPLLSRVRVSSNNSGGADQAEQATPTNPVPPVPQPPTNLDLARRTLARWCDWLDALIHFQTHQHWHLAPACFDPDPDQRELAVLGSLQRHWVHLDASAQARWHHDFSAAAQHFKDSPKWPTLGKAMCAHSDRLWQYAEVDTLVISLWPLVQKYNWTYRDLLNVIRPGLTRPEAYPCASEQEFATYCVNVLGMRKTGKGVSAKGGKPAGYDVALRLCPERPKAKG